MTPQDTTSAPPPFDTTPPPSYLYGHAVATPHIWRESVKDVHQEPTSNSGTPPLTSPRRQGGARYIAHWIAGVIAAIATCGAWILPTYCISFTSSDFELSHTYAFLVWAHLLIGVESTALVLLFVLMRRLFKLPSATTLSASLMHGQSSWSQWLATLLDYFHDDAIDSAMSKASPSAYRGHQFAAFSNPQQQPVAGCYDSQNRSSAYGVAYPYPAGSMAVPDQQPLEQLVAHDTLSPAKEPWWWRWTSRGLLPLMCITWAGGIFGRYLWVESLRRVSVPFVDVVECAFIIYLPALASAILKEPLHGLKLLSSISSFVGVYFYVFSSSSPTTIDQPLPGAVKDMMIGACMSLTAAFCLAFYLVFYKYYNPKGWMLTVLGFQGFSSGLFGLLLLPVIDWIFGHHSTTSSWIPSTWQDWLSVQRYSAWMCLLYYCINEALRWGSPSSVSAALVLAPVLGHVLQMRAAATTGPALESGIRAIALDVPTTARSKVHFLNHGQLTGLILSLLGCVIDALYQFGKAVKRSKRASRQQLLNAQPVMYYFSPMYSSSTGGPLFSRPAPPIIRLPHEPAAGHHHNGSRGPPNEKDALLYGPDYSL